MSNIVIVIAEKDYQDKEYEDTRAALEEAGHKILTRSSHVIAHGKFGGEVIIDLLTYDPHPMGAYDAIVLIGGSGCYQYFDDPEVRGLVKEFNDNGRIVAAICAAPMILANAGILKGKKATCWDGEAENLQKKGARYTGADVEQDGNIITGNGPMAATAFGQKIAENLNS